MICKKWTDGELVLSVETEDKFWEGAAAGPSRLIGGMAPWKSLTNSSALLCDRLKFSR